MVVFCAKLELEHMEIHPGTGARLAKTIGKIQRTSCKDDFVIGFCCRTPTKEKETDEKLFKQLDKISQLKIWVLKEKCNHYNISWKGNMCGCN